MIEEQSRQCVRRMRAQQKAEFFAEQGLVQEAAYWQRIHDLVDAAPPLSQDQKDRLRILLRP